MENLTPKQVVAELDRYIVGQADAKRAVAVAVRNRWRRQQLLEGMRHDVAPKNILKTCPLEPERLAWETSLIWIV